MTAVHYLWAGIFQILTPEKDLGFSRPCWINYCILCDHYFAIRNRTLNKYGNPPNCSGCLDQFLKDFSIKNIQINMN